MSFWHKTSVSHDILKMSLLICKLAVLSVKAALVNIFKLTMGQITMYYVKRLSIVRNMLRIITQPCNSTQLCSPLQCLLAHCFDFNAHIFYRSSFQQSQAVVFSKTTLMNTLFTTYLAPNSSQAKLATSIFGAF